MATGLTFPGALGQAAAALPWVDLKPLWKAWMQNLPAATRIRTVLDACETIAAASPDAGTAALWAWLRQGPVAGDLELPYCAWISKLPPDLEVYGSLNLIDCSGLTALPNGLKIQGNLDLTGCSGWNGLLPKSTWVFGSVYSDFDAYGLSMSAWRKRHGRGPGRPQGGNHD
jgi:hypothetical protein